jgi:hypothetical protein
MANFVVRSLNPKNIILSENYHKNDLFLINAFDLERKGEESFSNYDIKYCSVGSHLKLSTSAVTQKPAPRTQWSQCATC